MSGKVRNRMMIPYLWMRLDQLISSTAISKAHSTGSTCFKDWQLPRRSITQTFPGMERVPLSRRFQPRFRGLVGEIRSWKMHVWNWVSCNVFFSTTEISNMNESMWSSVIGIRLTDYQSDKGNCLPKDRRQSPLHNPLRVLSAFPPRHLCHCRTQLAARPLRSFHICFLQGPDILDLALFGHLWRSTRRNKPDINRRGIRPPLNFMLQQSRENSW